MSSNATMMLTSPCRERQEALEAEARVVAEKEARLADERKRAEEKIRKKEERKREKEEVCVWFPGISFFAAQSDTFSIVQAIRHAAEQAERQVREAEQQQRDEEERVRRAEEEKKRAEIEVMEKAKREKAEAEKRKRQEEERKRKAEERRIKEEERRIKEEEPFEWRRAATRICGTPRTRSCKYTGFPRFICSLIQYMERETVECVGARGQLLLESLIPIATTPQN